LRAGLAAGFFLDAFAMACAAALRAFSAARSSFVAAFKSFIIFWIWAGDMGFFAVDALALDVVRRADMVRLAMFLTSWYVLGEFA
jgi:undecaprenyl pyrophosphate phosphatase UppP